MLLGICCNYVLHNLYLSPHYVDNQLKENDVGETCCTHQTYEIVYTLSSEIDHPGNLFIGWGILFKCVLEE
jgi:hypothetical protein